MCTRKTANNDRHILHVDMYDDYSRYKPGMLRALINCWLARLVTAQNQQQKITTKQNHSRQKELRSKISEAK